MWGVLREQSIYFIIIVSRGACKHFSNFLLEIQTELLQNFHNWNRLCRMNEQSIIFIIITSRACKLTNEFQPSVKIFGNYKFSPSFFKNNDVNLICYFFKISVHYKIYTSFIITDTRAFETH